MLTDKTALLVMDVQPGIIDRVAQPQAYLAGVQETVAAAHEHDIPVIYVVVGFRAGFPEVSPQNSSFKSIKEGARTSFINPGPVIPPVKGDVVVTKRRVSAFSGSDLEVVLRAQGINHLVLCGIATSGVVLSTLREAADKDYRLTVLADLCSDSDALVHEVLTAKVFPRQATVMQRSEWISSLQR